MNIYNCAMTVYFRHCNSHFVKKNFPLFQNKNYQQAALLPAEQHVRKNKKMLKILPKLKKYVFVAKKVFRYVTPLLYVVCKQK